MGKQWRLRSFVGNSGNEVGSANHELLFFLNNRQILPEQFKILDIKREGVVGFVTGRGTEFITIIYYE